MMSARQTGEGNCNYVNGRASGFVRVKGHKRWVNQVKALSANCMLTGRKIVQCHHILPVALCNSLRQKVANGITLCASIHYWLHLERLDILLLPDLIAVSPDKLRDAFLAHPKILDLRNRPVEYHSWIEFVKMLPRNYRKESQKLLGFVPPAVIW